MDIHGNQDFTVVQKLGFLAVQKFGFSAVQKFDLTWTLFEK